MKKLILVMFLFSALIAGAQNIDSTLNCKAYFIYSFATDLKMFAPGVGISFIDQSDGKVVSWNWDFGDGATSTEQNPLHMYTYPNYPNRELIMMKISPYRTVTLTIITADSCTTTYSEIIDIYDVPAPGGKTCKSDFYFYQTGYDSLAKTATFKFMNMSGAESPSYLWNFSDGLTSTEAEPEMTFDFSRTERKVCLTVTGTDSCSDELCQAVYIDPNGWGTDPVDTIISNCYVAFGYSVNPDKKLLEDGVVLDFYPKTDNKVVKYLWDFGDGDTSYDANPTHFFKYPSYPGGGMRIMFNPYRTVTLAITTEDGCTSTYSESIDIYNFQGNDGKTCKSDFYFYQTGYDSLAKTATFKFINMSGAESPSYLWNFSDGLTSTEAEPEMTFDFSRTERKVCLTVSGADSCSDELCQSVYINPKGWETDPIDSTNSHCYVAFGYSVNRDIKPFAPALVLDFYAKADHKVAKYLWDFGDGATSNEANPMHMFNYPIVQDSILGEPNPFRTICLTITTVDGCESMWCETINIYMDTKPVDLCDATFGYYQSNNNFTAPESATYKFFSNGKNIISWNWSFEDGTVSYETEPIMTFDPSKPTQDVCLTILTADSCKSTWCETIYVSDEIIDTIYPEPTCGYRFKYTSDYPAWASACIGTVTAQVVMGDSLIPTDYYYWTTYDGQMVDGSTLNNLCPTQTYTVTARTIDGCKFSASFIFNSDGTVTEVPICWWINGWGDDSYVEYELPDSSYTVEWIGCDGSVYSGDSIRLSKISCGSDQPNMIMKDAKGNIIYSKNIAIPTEAPAIPDQKKMMIFPNPVMNSLNLRFNTITDKDARFEITDLTGKVLQRNKLTNGKSGQQVGIDVSLLGRGVYFGKIVSGNKVIAAEKFSK